MRDQALEKMLVSCEDFGQGLVEVPDVLKIQMKSSKRSLHDLVQVLMRRSCENLADIV